MHTQTHKGANCYLQIFNLPVINFKSSAFIKSVSRLKLALCSNTSADKFKSSLTIPTNNLLNWKWSIFCLLGISEIWKGGGAFVYRQPVTERLGGLSHAWMSLPKLWVCQHQFAKLTEAPDKQCRTTNTYPFCLQTSLWSSIFPLLGIRAQGCIHTPLKKDE